MADDKVSFVIRTLQQDIVFGLLKPRERLVEEEMSDRFAIGRHVVRAVLEELDRAGLVVRRPNRGAVVRDYLAAEIEQLYDLRRVQHWEAAMRIKLPGSAQFVETLRSLNQRYRICCEKGTFYEAAGLNDEFHLTLNAACGNSFLVELIQNCWLNTAVIHSRCYITNNRPRIAETIKEHDAIVAAVQSGTNEQLARLCLDHMKPALTDFKGQQGTQGRSAIDSQARVHGATKRIMNPQ